MSNILHLTLHKKWFDMILSGEKREEYREIKPYWDKRLCKGHTMVKFVNGYGADKPWMVVQVKEHLMSLGIVEWGAPEGVPVHIIRLGNVMCSGNIKDKA
mgnify:CR=1 FL=1